MAAVKLLKRRARESNNLVVSYRGRTGIFCKTYTQTIIIVTTPVVLFPLIFAGKAYTSLYLFLVCSVYWSTRVLHPAVVSLLPVAYVTLAGPAGWQIIHTVHLRNPVLDCLGMMLMAFGVENSDVHKRLAIKILLLFGISHFRLSFVLFFSTMVLSMCITETLSCCVMLPVVHATLIQLEQMGVVDMHEDVHKEESTERTSKAANVPADFTIFYYLGIAFSSTIGGTASILGNSPNRVFLSCYTSMFPLGPKMEFPQIMLMTLPGALLMEAALYLWLNFYFLGMLRVQSYTALETGLNCEEVQYVTLLLRNRYAALGAPSPHDMMVIGALSAATLMEICLGVVDNYFTQSTPGCHAPFASAPLLVTALLLFLLPIDVGCIKFCKKRGSAGPLPATHSRACLEWSAIDKEALCSVTCVTAGCNLVFESLHDSGMIDELGTLLALISQWSVFSLTFLIIVMCKIFTEFASNATVAYCVLQVVANLSVLRKTDPRYLMMSATLACGLSFHLITSSPVNAFVKFYGNIPRRKMMTVATGPAAMAVLTTLFTTCVWSKAIWPITNLI